MDTFTREFPNTGDTLSGSRDAREWLEASGYSCGSMQGDEPIGIVKGACMISKWHGLSPLDRDGLDGRITWKDGGVVVTLKAAP